MQVFHENPDTEYGLEDAEPTIRFIERMSALIKAMSSNSPQNALKKDQCEVREVMFYYLKKSSIMS